MKFASAATLAILATGQYVKFEFYQFILADNTQLRYVNADAPIGIFQTGLTLSRTSCRQKRGLEVQTMQLEIWPQPDNPAGPVMVAGYPFVQAAHLGIFDGATVQMSKGFYNAPVLGVLDTSPGRVAWKQGKVNNVKPSRSKVILSIADDTQNFDVAMPRNVLQTGCVHSLFDSGCGLSRAAFTVSGSVSGAPGVLQFNTGLTQPNGYFDLGRIVFTSGVNNGLKRTVKSYVNASGQVTLIVPLPVAPSAGDTFSIEPGCPKTQAACENNNSAVAPAFNNKARFRGYPYVPVPETLYDGGTPNSAAPAIAGQGGAGAGSAFTGRIGRNTYVA